MLSIDPCIFQQLCPGDTVLISAGKGRTIYAPGQSVEYLYHLHEGVVAITVTTQQGDEQVIAVIVPPQFIGSAGLVGMNNNKKREFLGEARAVTQVTYCKVRKAAVWRLLDNPEVRAQVFNNIFSSTLDMSNLIASPSVDAIPRRVRYILKVLGRGIGQKCDNGLIVIRGLSHEEIATIANTSRSTVTRILKDMERAGIITVHNRHIVFNADFAPLYTGRVQHKQSEIVNCYSG